MNEQSKSGAEGKIIAIVVMGAVIACLFFSLVAVATTSKEKVVYRDREVASNDSSKVDSLEKQVSNLEDQVDACKSSLIGIIENSKERNDLMVEILNSFADGNVNTFEDEILASNEDFNVKFLQTIECDESIVDYDFGF